MAGLHPTGLSFLYVASVINFFFCKFLYPDWRYPLKQRFYSLMISVLINYDNSVTFISFLNNNIIIITKTWKLVITGWLNIIYNNDNWTFFPFWDYKKQPLEIKFPSFIWVFKLHLHVIWPKKHVPLFIISGSTEFRERISATSFALLAWDRKSRSWKVGTLYYFRSRNFREQKLSQIRESLRREKIFLFFSKLVGCPW